MRVFIVYCHPSEESFTARVRDQFIRGLKLAGHTYEISDLYKMNFQSDMTEEEYKRDAFYTTEGYMSADVLAEQEKIQGCDVIVFIYPIFWTEAPAKLVGWFNFPSMSHGTEDIRKLNMTSYLDQAFRLGAELKV